MADWFYGKDGTQHGPVSEQEIANLIASGQIDAQTIVWREGMADWVPVSQATEFQSPSQGAANPYGTPQTHPAQGGMPHLQAAPPTDNLAITSMVLGILSLVMCGLFTGIPAVICGHMSYKKIRTSPTPLAGKGMATAGLITGYISIIITVLVILMYVGIFATAAASGM